MPVVEEGQEEEDEEGEEGEDVADSERHQSRHWSHRQQDLWGHLPEHVHLPSSNGKNIVDDNVEDNNDNGDGDDDVDCDDDGDVCH